MKQYAVLLNGPPGCGKDTLCSMLWSEYQMGTFKHLEVKAQLFTDTFEYFQLDAQYRELFSKLHNDRAEKEVPREWLNNRSTRQALIHVSEDVMKPLNGPNHYGISAARNVRQAFEQGYKVVAFSDGGFRAEVEEISKVAETIVFRLRGRGSFAGDSRSYLDCPDLDVRYVDIDLVDGRPELALDVILDTLKAIDLE